MAYVRTKKTRNKTTGKDYEYFQLVESRWVDGKPRQKVVLHLGPHPSPDALYDALEAEAGRVAEEHNELLRKRTNLKRRLGRMIAALGESEERGEFSSREQGRALHAVQENIWRLGDEVKEKGDRYDAVVGRQESVYPYLSDERRASIDRHREIMRRFGE